MTDHQFYPRLIIFSKGNDHQFLNPILFHQPNNTMSFLNVKDKNMHKDTRHPSQACEYCQCFHQTATFQNMSPSQNQKKESPVDSILLYFSQLSGTIESYPKIYYSFQYYKSNKLYFTRTNK